MESSIIENDESDAVKKLKKYESLIEIITAQVRAGRGKGRAREDSLAKLTKIQKILKKRKEQLLLNKNCLPSLQRLYENLEKVLEAPLGSSHKKSDRHFSTEERSEPAESSLNLSNRSDSHSFTGDSEVPKSQVMLINSSESKDCCGINIQTSIKPGKCESSYLREHLDASKPTSDRSFTDIDGVVPNSKELSITNSESEDCEIKIHALCKSESCKICHLKEQLVASQLSPINSLSSLAISRNCQPQNHLSLSERGSGDQSFGNWKLISHEGINYYTNLNFVSPLSQQSAFFNPSQLKDVDFRWNSTSMWNEQNTFPSSANCINHSHDRHVKQNCLNNAVSHNLPPDKVQNPIPSLLDLKFDSNNKIQSDNQRGNNTFGNYQYPSIQNNYNYEHAKDYSGPSTSQSSLSVSIKDIVVRVNNLSEKNMPEISLHNRESFYSTDKNVVDQIRDPRLRKLVMLNNNDARLISKNVNSNTCDNVKKVSALEQNKGSNMVESLQKRFPSQEKVSGRRYNLSESHIQQKSGNGDVCSEQEITSLSKPVNKIYVSHSSNKIVTYQSRNFNNESTENLNKSLQSNSREICSSGCMNKKDFLIARKQLNSSVTAHECSSSSFLGKSGSRELNDTDSHSVFPKNVHQNLHLNDKRDLKEKNLSLEELKMKFNLQSIDESLLKSLSSVLESVSNPDNVLQVEMSNSSSKRISNVDVDRQFSVCESGLVCNLNSTKQIIKSDNYLQTMTAQNVSKINSFDKQESCKSNEYLKSDFNENRPKLLEYSYDRYGFKINSLNDHWRRVERKSYQKINSYSIYHNRGLERNRIPHTSVSRNLSRYSDEGRSSCSGEKNLLRVGNCYSIKRSDTILEKRTSSYHERESYDKYKCMRGVSVRYPTKNMNENRNDRFFNDGKSKSENRRFSSDNFKCVRTLKQVNDCNGCDNKHFDKCQDQQFVHDGFQPRNINDNEDKKLNSDKTAGTCSNKKLNNIRSGEMDNNDKYERKINNENSSTQSITSGYLRKPFNQNRDLFSVKDGRNSQDRGCERGENKSVVQTQVHERKSFDSSNKQSFRDVRKTDCYPNNSRSGIHATKDVSSDKKGEKHSDKNIKNNETKYSQADRIKKNSDAIHATEKNSSDDIDSKANSKYLLNTMRYGKSSEDVVPSNKRTDCYSYNSTTGIQATRDGSPDEKGEKHSDTNRKSNETRYSQADRIKKNSDAIHATKKNSSDIDSKDNSKYLLNKVRYGKSSEDVLPSNKNTDCYSDSSTTGIHATRDSSADEKGEKHSDTNRKSNETRYSQADRLKKNSDAIHATKKNSSDIDSKDNSKYLLNKVRYGKSSEDVLPSNKNTDCYSDSSTTGIHATRDGSSDEKGEKHSDINRKSNETRYSQADRIKKNSDAIHATKKNSSDIDSKNNSKYLVNTVRYGESSKNVVPSNKKISQVSCQKISSIIEKECKVSKTKTNTLRTNQTINSKARPQSILMKSTTSNLNKEKKSMGKKTDKPDTSDHFSVKDCRPANKNIGKNKNVKSKVLKKHKAISSKSSCEVVNKKSFTKTDKQNKSEVTNNVSKESKNALNGINLPIYVSNTTENNMKEKIEKKPSNKNSTDAKTDIDESSKPENKTSESGNNILHHGDCDKIKCEKSVYELQYHSDQSCEKKVDINDNSVKKGREVKKKSLSAKQSAGSSSIINKNSLQEMIDEDFTNEIVKVYLEKLLASRGCMSLLSKLEKTPLRDCRLSKIKKIILSSSSEEENDDEDLKITKTKTDCNNRKILHSSEGVKDTEDKSDKIMKEKSKNLLRKKKLTKDVKAKRILRSKNANKSVGCRKKNLNKFKRKNELERLQDDLNGGNMFTSGYTNLSGIRSCRLKHNRSYSDDDDRNICNKIIKAVSDIEDRNELNTENTNSVTSTQQETETNEGNDQGLHLFPGKKICKNDNTFSTFKDLILRSGSGVNNSVELHKVVDSKSTKDSALINTSDLEDSLHRRQITKTITVLNAIDESIEPSSTNDISSNSAVYFAKSMKEYPKSKELAMEKLQSKSVALNPLVPCYEFWNSGKTNIKVGYVSAGIKKGVLLFICGVESCDFCATLRADIFLEHLNVCHKNLKFQAACSECHFKETEGDMITCFMHLLKNHLFKESEVNTSVTPELTFCVGGTDIDSKALNSPENATLRIENVVSLAPSTFEGTITSQNLSRNDVISQFLCLKSSNVSQSQSNRTVQEKCFSTQVMVVTEQLLNDNYGFLHIKKNICSLKTQTSVSFMSANFGPLACISSLNERELPANNKQKCSVLFGPFSKRMNRIKKNCKFLYGNLKQQSIFKGMLSPEKLKHLFKCMEETCDFTCEWASQFKTHCSHHVMKKQKSSLSGNKQMCAYCCGVFDNAYGLCEHITAKHLLSDYQCAYCFYRTCCTSNVILHQNITHNEENIFQMLKWPLHSYLHTPVMKEVIPRKADVVQPYVCYVLYCCQKFYTAGAFKNHFQKHIKSQSICSCVYCDIQFPSEDQLIKHYRRHSINLYQCLYCSHGSDTEQDIRKHLCVLHPGYMPRAVMRVNQNGNLENEHLDDLKECNFDDQAVEASYILEYTNDQLQSANTSDVHSNHLYNEVCTSINVESNIDSYDSDCVLIESNVIQKKKQSVPPVLYPDDNTEYLEDNETDNSYKRSGEVLVVEPPYKKINLTNLN